MKRLFAIFACLLAVSICLVSCGTVAENSQTLAKGGVIRLKVNPEIAISYDDAGNVTAVEARNDDAAKILEKYAGFEGKACKTVVAELVAVIGEAGYFVEDIDGNSRQITIELESGSNVPNDKFLDEVADEVLNTVDTNEWTAPIEIKDDDIVETEEHIGKDAAIEKSLTEAGLTTEEIGNIMVEFDDEDNKAVYEVEFVKDGVEHEYTVDGISGEILDVEIENDDDDDDDDLDDDDDDDIVETEEHIGREAAIEKALADAGFTAEEVANIKAEFDGDDNKAVYEVDFVKDGVEHEYTVDGISGEIINVETDLDDVDNEDDDIDDEDDDIDDDDDDDIDDDDDDDIDDDDDDIVETEEHIGIEAAIEKALADAGFAAEEVVNTKAEFDGDDNKAVYEVDFVKDGVEHEYTVDGISGEIINVETDLDDVDDDNDDFDNDDDEDDEDDEDDDDDDDDD